MKKIVLLIVLLLTTLATSAGLDGRIVILLVSEHRSGDPRMEAVRKALLAERDRLGYSTNDMPIVFMGFKDSDTERQYFDRLGFQAFDSPVLCVAEWGNPGRFGPKRVIDYAIARSATPDHIDFIIRHYQRAVGDEHIPTTNPSPNPTPPPNTPPQSAGLLEIENIRFEAAGKPLYMTNVGVRIRNSDDHTILGITIRFYNKLNKEDEWRLMGEKTLEKLPAGYVASRDIVGDSKDYRLVGPNGNAIKCFWRIEVEQGGKVVSEEGEFIPSEGPVGVNRL